MGFDGKDNQQDTPFNMAMMYYIGLNKIIQAKRIACLEDDYVEWYKVLRLLYREISFKFNKSEKTKADKLFTKSKNLLPMLDKSPIFPQQLYHHLDEVDMYLTEIMNKRHMIFPNIDIKGGLKDIGERYGLDGTDKNN